MIRKAQTGDLTELLALGKKLQVLSPYAAVPLDILTCGQTLGQCISNAFGFAVVAVHEGKITGFMMGAAVPLWFSKKRSASDIVTYAETPGDGYRMISRFVKWAWSVPNVIEITLAQSSGIDVERTGALYERVGMKRVGSIFTAVREAVAVEDAA